ncbi:DUF6000 family protein [Streptomyces sp. WAC08241]|uniref:DUF6000 family protein n=1 Tax=Streptomyces sp. WAC08241 TaxID=2487421 RepID=UPI001C8E4A5E|nr:DUF6000 family protein [Streptomyces sp. WAC08241]
MRGALQECAADAGPVGPARAGRGALLRLDAHLGTHHANRFTEPDGLWDEWTRGTGHLDHPDNTPAGLRRRTDLHCDFAHGWTRP